MTLEELLTLLAANPDLANQLFDARAAEIQTHLTGKGLVIKPQADFDKAIADAKKEGDGEATKRNHDAWGKALADVLGIQKPDGKKELDFFPEEIKKTYHYANRPSKSNRQRP